MKRRWSDEELALSWQIWPEEYQMIQDKRGATRLGFAVLLKYFQIEGRFPSGPYEVPSMQYFLLQTSRAWMPRNGINTHVKGVP